MTSKTKYIVIVLLLLVLATTSVGLSTWNIHYQAIVGDIDFTMQDPSTKDSVLNRYIYFTPAKDADGNITTKKQSYPIGRGGAEDIFTYIYDANPHTPTVFVPSEGTVKGSDNYPTDLFLADGALDSKLVWGIEDVFGEIEFKYEYRLIAMPYVSEDYKGKSENFCEITAIEYYENKINVYLTWKNGNKGNNQGENVLVELLLSGGTFNIPQDGMSDEQYKIVKGKIENNVSFAVDTVTVGVNGFSPFTISTADNGWVETAPSNAGVYQCRITAQLKDDASGNIDTANKAIAQLNSLDEGKYAAQVTYAILPRNSEMAQIGYSYEKSSATEQQIKARRNLANTMPLAESAEVTTDEDGLHTINGNSNSFYVTYGGVGFEISITSTFATLDGSDNVSFPISEYLFTNANALKELLADGQTWDQNENHYYTTYGFSPDPNYQITNPEVHYTILRREISIDSWTTTDLVYNGTTQSQSAHTNNSYDSTFDYSWTKADGTELDSAPIDAGSYKVWASVGENYYLSCVEGAGTLDETSGMVSFDYTIAPKPVEITWTNTDTLVYNGSAQAPTATANGLCTRDGSVDLCTVTVTGEQTNAGTGYQAEATALSNPNYVLATKDGGWTTTFKIDAKPVGILWSQNMLSLTYNSKAQNPNAYVADTDLCSQNGKKDTCAVIVTGEQTNVGDYTATATSLSNPNYVLAEGTWETAFKITPKPVTITWTNTDTLVYNGNAQAPTATASGIYATDTCTVTVTGAQTDAGTGYTATATELSNDNYEFANNATLTTTFKIQQLTATLAWANTSAVYDGQAHKPTATVSNLCSQNGVMDTCTVTVDGEQTNANATGETYTATATALSNSNYALPTNATQQFKISPKSITLTWSGATLTYNGQAQAPTASIASGLVAGDTCTVDVTADRESKNVGNYTATATLSNDNYSATNSTQTFEITQLEIGINWTNLSFTYDGTSHAPTATATGLVGGDTVIITVDGAQTNAGTGYTATATAVSNSNYKLPANATITFTIDQKTIGISWANTTLEYNGTPRKPTATATGLVGDDTCTITVTIDEKNVNIGTFNAEATAVSNPNYKLPTSKSTHYTITAKSVTITWAGTTLTYNGNAQAPTATVEGLVSADVDKVSITIDGYQTNAGTGYTATATLAGDKAVNYTITSGSTTTFTINKAPNEIVWSDDSLTADKTALVGWTFGSAPIAHTATAAQGGNVAITYYTTYNATTGECSGEFTPSSTTSAGTYYAKAVSQDSGSNYHGTSIVMSFAVTPATLVGATVTLEEHENFVYDGTEKTVAIKSVVLANGTVLTAYNVTGLTATNAGTHTVTVTVPNYEGSATAEFVIAQKEITLTWGNTSFTYNGSAQAPTVTVNGVISGDNYVVTVEGAQTNAGNYTATAKAPAGGNYKISGSTTASFSIAQASVTSANCTTNDIFEGEAIKLTGTTANGVTINSTVESVSGTYTISDASNAVFSDTGESSQTVGKTIKVLFTPSNGNYKATIFDVTVNVKAVAYIKNGNYFGNLPAAVESAKNGTNKTVIVIVGTTINISENLTLDNSITVKVPYDGETTMATVTSGTAALKSTINFTNEADLIINNGSTLELGGQIGTKGIIGSYCQINLGVGSSITVNGSFNAYGYVKETSPVTGISNSSQVIYDNSTDSERYILISSTGYIITPFKTDDISGGTTLTGKVEANICPTYNFQFHALQTYVIVETGGILASTAYVQIAGQNADANVGIIYPATSSTESMFYQESGYISIEWCSSSKTIIYISGSAKMGKIYISARGYPIDSDDMFIPIHSRFSIYIGGTMDTNGKKIKFLPGSYVEVLKGGSFNINGTSSSPSKVIIYPLSAMTGLGLSGYSKDAEFVNNGTITLNSYGSMGGVVNTSVTDGSAIVDLSSVTSAGNLTLTDVEWVGGKAVNIANVDLTGPFYDETTQSTEMSLFTHGSAINSHPEMSCWVGTIVLMDDVTLTVLKTGVPTEAFNYTIYTNSTATDSGQYEQIPSNTSTRSQSFSLARGTYIKIEDIVSTAITVNGVSYTSGTWLQVTGTMTIEITPTASFTVTCNHTNGNSGAGNIKRSITYGPNEGSMTEVASKEDGSAVTVKIPAGWVFKVSDNASVSGTSKVTKTIYNEDGTTTKTDIATASGQIAWSSSTIYTADGDYLFTSDNVTCFAPGTLITMADGSLVAIENLKPGDFVLSYDFETGSFTPTIVAEVTNHGLTECQILTLNFNNNTSIRLIAYHGFFDVTEMRYLDISVDNYQDYIGHEFMAYDGNGNVVIKRLVSATVSTEQTSSYSLTAAVYINAIADGLITITPPMTNWYNMFDVDGNFKWNEQLMAQDIDKYGLFTYAEVESMIPYEIFVASNFRYFKVAMAKGLVTMAEIEEFVAWYNELIESGEIVLGDMSQFLPPQENTNTTDAVEATLPPPVVTGSDDNSGDGDGSSDEDTSE